MSPVYVVAVVAGAFAASPAGAVDDAAAYRVGFDVIDAQFADPPAVYRMVQYTGHHSPIAPVEKMGEYGIGGVMLFLGSKDYLRSDEGWAVMAENIRRAKEAGLQVWVADDNGFPSGMAGGRVVEANPAFEVRGLVQVAIEGEGPGPVRLDLPPDLELFVAGALYPKREGAPDLAAGRAAEVSDNCVAGDGIEGPWVLAGYALDVIDEGTQAMQTARQFQTSGRYANLLDAEAMAAFVEMTHAEYARRLGQLAGRVEAFYTNEPNLMTLYFEAGNRPNGRAYVPWDDSIPARFKAEHGYDLPPSLGALFGGEGDDAKLVRRHYYETVGDLMVESFSGRIAKWAEEHGVRSGGHLLLEEFTSMHVICYGSFLQVLAEQHVPGCDIPMPDVGQYWNYWMPKYVSSAAYLRGRTVVSALLDPIIGRPTPILEPGPDDFRRIISMAFLSGANLVTTYIRWENYDPAVYRGYNEYVGRLALLLRGATNAADIAVYYPIETFQAAYVPSPEFWSPIAWRYQQNGMQASQDESVRLTLESGRDANYIDADAVRGAELVGGRLVVGANRYRAVVMPGVELLPLDVLQKLGKFAEAGGQVFWVDKTPRMGDAPDQHERVRAAAPKHAAITSTELVDRLGPPNPEGFGLTFEPPGDGLFTVRYTRNGRNLYYVVNNESAATARTVRGQGDGGSVRVYNPLDGSITDRALPAEVDFTPYAGLVVVE